MEDQLPIKPEAQKQLDELHPGYNFMTITDMATGARKLVGTSQSITLQPLYAEQPVEDEAHLEILSKLIVEDIEAKKSAARWRGPHKYIVAHHTPEEWQEIKREQALDKLNTLVKPRRKA